MKNVDIELINEELKKDREDGFVFTYKKLSNKFLDWLFNHYYCAEQCVNSYDSEPIDDYNEWCELQKTADGRSKLAQAYRDYEPQRMRFCNWQEPTMEGSWGMTQVNVDKYAKESLKRIRNIPASKKDRIYYAQKDEQIRIYIYDRDLWQDDIWYIFKKR